MHVHWKRNTLHASISQSNLPPFLISLMLNQKLTRDPPWTLSKPRCTLCPAGDVSGMKMQFWEIVAIE